MQWAFAHPCHNNHMKLPNPQHASKPQMTTPQHTQEWISSSPTLYHISSHRMAWASPQNSYTHAPATFTHSLATSTINPLVYGQPKSHTTVPVANRHPQPHNTHPIPICSRQRKPLNMKVVVIRCREECKTLKLKIISGHSSGASCNKFLFNDFSFPFVQLQ